MALPFNYPSYYDASWPIQPSLAHYESPSSWAHHENSYSLSAQYESPYFTAAQSPPFHQETTQVNQFLPQPDYDHVSQTSHLGWDNYSDSSWDFQPTPSLAHDPQSLHFCEHLPQSNFYNDADQVGHVMQSHLTYPQTNSIEDQFTQLQQIVMSNQQALNQLESQVGQLLEDTLREEVESQQYSDGLAYQPIPPYINDPILVDDLYEAHNHQSPNVVKINEIEELKLGGEEEGEESTLDCQPTFFLPQAFDDDLFQVEEDEIPSEETDLSALPWTSWEMEEPVIPLEILVDRAPLDFEASVDFLPIPDFGEPTITVEILKLADWSTPPEPTEHLCVKEYVHLVPDDSFILDTSQFVESQQTPIIITQSEISITNSQFKVMDECCGGNKVQIDVLNTYKDLKCEEEYYVIHDMIINTMIPLLYLVGLLGLFDPQWFATPIKARLWRQLIGGVT